MHTDRQVEGMNDDETSPMLGWQRASGSVVWWAVVALALLAVGAGAVWFYTCPCERIPGGYLSGRQAEEAVSDWGFANQVQLCQIETRAGLLPHSINLNCMASGGGELFLSCSQCEGKRWSSAALENPVARIRLDGVVYPVTLSRLTSNQELQRAWRARAEKLAQLRGSDLEAIPERPDHWWSFQVNYRPG